MYLEPIFGSEDIKKQLPSESKKFQSIDRNLRRMVDGVLKKPAAIDACTRGGQRTLDMLRDGNKVLDGVQKVLSDYLQTKRAGFGRFDFLSNDELLEILSQTKEVRIFFSLLHIILSCITLRDIHVRLGDSSSATS
jgi:dynein heavy chain